MVSFVDAAGPGRASGGASCVPGGGGVFVESAHVRVLTGAGKVEVAPSRQCDADDGTALRYPPAVIDASTSAVAWPWAAGRRARDPQVVGPAGLTGPGRGALPPLPSRGPGRFSRGPGPAKAGVSRDNAARNCRAKPP